MFRGTLSKLIPRPSNQSQFQSNRKKANTFTRLYSAVGWGSRPNRKNWIFDTLYSLSAQFFLFYMPLISIHILLPLPEWIQLDPEPPQHRFSHLFALCFWSPKALQHCWRGAWHEGQIRPYFYPQLAYSICAALGETSVLILTFTCDTAFYTASSEKKQLSGIWKRGVEEAKKFKRRIRFFSEWHLTWTTSINTYELSFEETDRSRGSGLNSRPAKWI